MAEVSGGFVLLGAVVAVGYLLGRWQVLGAGADTVLSRLAFFVASPALLLTTVADADLGAVFSRVAAVSVGTAVLLAALYVAVGLLTRRPGTEVVIGALSASYVNAGNLGIPVLVLVAGTAAPIAPVLVLQLLVMVPVSFTVLDVLTGRSGVSRVQVLSTPVRNPLVLSVVAGTVLAATGWQLPALVQGPIQMLADVAVPVMLLAFGISLRGAPLPGRGEIRGPMWVAVGLKTVAAPVVAFVLGGPLLGLSGRELLTALVIAALPTAQNIFVYAMRYGRSVALARESILVTTALSVPVILTVAAVLS